MPSDEVGPGDNVDITISAKPNSYVGLLAVDQRSLLLKSGNDISYVRLLLLLLTVPMGNTVIIYDQCLQCDRIN